ncbi:hypothetical protein CVIRNUC_007776 [Coccomyxa viridis]|uniref:Uncharacterized protein n=1 Tax=Coccomyxa viridis TaxID=1274662 RepID=A0AAV1IEF2_9CHLO|nr:hypothetical protein CVIRNUC_007776 [Coccomyxa viridis]
MNLFKKFKDYVLGEDLKPKADCPPEDLSGPQPRAGSHRKVATKQPAQPVLQNPGYGSSGGVQGLDWYTKGLKEDSDGDVASEFLEESSTPSRRVQQSSASADTPASLKVQSHDLRPAGPGDVIVHGGEVHLVSSDR